MTDEEDDLLGEGEVVEEDGVEAGDGGAGEDHEEAVDEGNFRSTGVENRGGEDGDEDEGEEMDAVEVEVFLAPRRDARQDGRARRGGIRRIVSIHRQFPSFHLRHTTDDPAVPLGTTQRRLKNERCVGAKTKLQTRNLRFWFASTLLAILRLEDGSAFGHGGGRGAGVPSTPSRRAHSERATRPRFSLSRAHYAGSSARRPLARSRHCHAHTRAARPSAASE